MLDGMSEYYSAELSVKVKRGQKENALKCKANGGTIPFGYRVNAERYFDVDPLTAPIVLEMFTRYADGQTVKEISADMNSRAIFANTRFKYTTKSSFHNLLKNRRYIGEYRYNADYRRSLVDIFVNSVFLYEDKIVLTFNWKDGTKMVSLAELEHADTDGEGEATAANVLNISDYRCSHLVRSSPPPNKCEPDPRIYRRGGVRFCF
jgi:hypothetical protein